MVPLLRPTFDQVQKGFGAVDWNSIIQDAVKSTTDIFKARFGVPPSGTMVYRRTPTSIEQVTRVPGVGVGVFPPVDYGPMGPIGTDSSTIMLLMLVLVVALASGKKE